VAVILRGRSAVEVLVIERSEREGDPWSGQLAFPGGRRATGDRVLLDTVRRETKEEVGLTLSRNARLIGWLPARAPGNRVEWDVVPFVFALTRAARVVPGPEVARAFWAPLDEMPSSLYRAVIELPGGDLEVPAFHVGGRPLWGFSFRVLCDLFDIVGWPGERMWVRPKTPPQPTKRRRK
jgi:8-oxo-dGTP pyrophosphatase MutT (NUDIX family)